MNAQRPSLPPDPWSIAFPTRHSPRREFLRFLATSPLLALAGFSSAWVEEVLAEPLQEQEPVLIKAAREALNVFDFERVARTKVSHPHMFFLTVGAYLDETVKANREGFTKYQVRLRRLTGITPAEVDISMNLFGNKWEAPIFLCPLGRMNAWHPEGNIPVAKAAKAKNTLELLSASTYQSFEEVSTARGQPVWYQVQPAPPVPSLIKRLEAAGCPAIVWTIDAPPGSNQSNALAIQSANVRNRDRTKDVRCANCHAHMPKRPMDMPAEPGSTPRTSWTWDDVKRLRDMTKMKVILKGIVAGEDAALAVQNGVDAVIVSNHAGHVDASARSTIESLPEVVAGANGRIPVMIDSGFRTGADIYKALAMGATAIGIGRPYVWGLASFDQDGVETVIELLRRELQIMMAQTGAPNIKKINPESIIKV